MAGDGGWARGWRPLCADRGCASGHPSKLPAAPEPRSCLLDAPTPQPAAQVIHRHSQGSAASWAMVIAPHGGQSAPPAQARRSSCGLLLPWRREAPCLACRMQNGTAAPYSQPGRYASMERWHAERRCRTAASRTASAHTPPRTCGWLILQVPRGAKVSLALIWQRGEGRDGGSSAQAEGRGAKGDRGFGSAPRAFVINWNTFAGLCGVQGVHSSRVVSGEWEVRRQEGGGTGGQSKEESESTPRAWARAPRAGG